MSRYGTGMRVCCDSINQPYAEHIKGCVNAWSIKRAGEVTEDGRIVGSVRDTYYTNGEVWVQRHWQKEAEKHGWKSTGRQFENIVLMERREG